MSVTPFFFFLTRKRKKSMREKKGLRFTASEKRLLHTYNVDLSCKRFSKQRTWHQLVPKSRMGAPKKKKKKGWFLHLVMKQMSSRPTWPTWCKPERSTRKAPTGLQRVQSTEKGAEGPKYREIQRREQRVQSSEKVVQNTEKGADGPEYREGSRWSKVQRRSRRFKVQRKEGQSKVQRREQMV